MARLAALLHDCAAPEVKEMVRLVDKVGIETAPGKGRAAPCSTPRRGWCWPGSVWGGGPRGSPSATPRAKDMSLLDRIIYLADMIERADAPFRGWSPQPVIDLDRFAVRGGRTVRCASPMPLNERTLELLKSLENDGIKENEA